VGFPAPVCTKPELKFVGQSKNTVTTISQPVRPLPEICCVIREQQTITPNFCQAKAQGFNLARPPMGRRRHTYSVQRKKSWATRCPPVGEILPAPRRSSGQRHCPRRPSAPVERWRALGRIRRLFGFPAAAVGRRAEPRSLGCGPAATRHARSVAASDHRCA
jgi:hypothetical protein